MDPPRGRGCGPAAGPGRPLNADNLVSLAPLILVALVAVMAMALSPFWRAPALHGLVGAGLAAAFMLVAVRFTAPGAPATALLADDPTARFGAALVLLSALATLAFVHRDERSREAPALVALAVCGALASVAATHAVTLVLGLEVTALALVVLFGFPLSGRAVEAGYKYFLMASVSAAALMFGMALSFSATGALDAAAWTGTSVMLSLGLALMLSALAFKFSLVPFHMWAPDVFAGAPPSAAALAGVVSKAAVAVVLVRLTMAGLEGQVWAHGLAAAGAASAILGNLVAISQRSLTRMLGYSSIAHSGYMALVLGSGAALSGEAVLFYMAAIAPALIAALCVAACLGTSAAASGSDPDIDELRGLIWRSPLAGAMLALALLSLAGLPPAIGFIGKAYIFSALAQASAWPHLAAAITGSALALVYYFRFTLVLFIREDGATASLSPQRTVVLGIAFLLILVPGLYPEPLIALSRFAAP